MSVLLSLARESIQEVYEASRTIDKHALLKEHPLLNEKIATTVNIYIEDSLVATHSSINPTKTLLEDVIINAKKAAFEGKNILKTSEYIECEIELILKTPDGVLKERDESILSKSKNNLFIQDNVES